MFHEFCVFPVRLVGRGTVPGPVNLLTLFPLILSDESFPGLRSLPHRHALLSTLLNTRGGTSVDLCSLSAQVSCLVLCPVNSSFLGLTRPSAPLLQLMGNAGFTSVPPLCAMGEETLSKH